MDTHLERTIIDYYMSMEKLLKSIGHEPAPNGSVFCPFHHNTQSKSAHLYKSEGGGVLYCFAEHKQYTPYTFYKTLFPSFDTTALAKAIFDKLPLAQKGFISESVNIEKELPQLPYIEDLKDFKKNKITYKKLLAKIVAKTDIEAENKYLTEIYRLEQNIPPEALKQLNNKYVDYLLEYKETNYKIIFTNTILKKVEIPEFLRKYLMLSDFHIMIPNIINDRLISASFRTLGERKQFLKCGDAMYLPYNLEGLGEDFSFGKPILLTEGSFDSDVIKDLFPYRLASLTAMLSTNQIQLISHLTDTLIIAYDNDEAGQTGYNILKYKLKGFNVFQFKHYSTLKDFGELYELKRKDMEEYEYIYSTYKGQLKSYL